MPDISLTNPRRVNVPDGWSLVPIENLCLAVTSGSTPLRSKSAYYENGSISWFKTGELKDGPLFTSEEKITGAALEQTSVKLYPAGTILMAMYGDGKTITSIGYLHSSAASNQACCAMIVNPDICTREYLFYALKNHREDFIRIATGGAQRNLSTRLIRRFGLALPPLRTQETIGSFLASIDDKIELNRRMNQTLEAMAQAIFRDWFVDFGPTRRKLVGATDPLTIMGGLVHDTERAQALADLFPAALGDDGLPEGWDSKPLLDQANWVNGAAYKNMHFSDAPDALPVVKIAELKNGVTISTKRTNTALGERYRISDGELLFSWSGNPDTSIDAFVWIGGDAWLNQHIFAVRENGTRSRAALYVLLKALMPQFSELARNKQTTGLGHVTKEDMKRLQIAVAPSAVEAAFEEVITPVFNLIISKLFENRTLAATRDLLLPKLMSGEIRLSEAEGLMEAAQ